MAQEFYRSLSGTLFLANQASTTNPFSPLPHGRQPTICLSPIDHLSRGEQMAMATAASVARWEDKEAPFYASKLLEPNCSADRGTDLWTTFNVIQENLIRGGVNYVNHTERNGRIVRERQTPSLPIPSPGSTSL